MTPPWCTANFKLGGNAFEGSCNIGDYSPARSDQEERAFDDESNEDNRNNMVYANNDGYLEGDDYVVVDDINNINVDGSCGDVDP